MSGFKIRIEIDDGYDGHAAFEAGYDREETEVDYGFIGSQVVRGLEAVGLPSIERVIAEMVESVSQDDRQVDQALLDWAERFLK